MKNTNTITGSSYTSYLNKIDKKDPNSNVIIFETKNEENEFSSNYNEITKIGEGYFLNPNINKYLKEIKNENTNQ